MTRVDAMGCVLEPMVAAHAHDLFAVLSDPAIHGFENSPPVDEAWLITRYERLERRGSSDGTQQWRNRVIRLSAGELAGDVQATVLPDRSCYVAYELDSRSWRNGIASRAVTAMLGEVRESYGVETFVAVLKATNFRSEGLLRKLGFGPASEAHVARHRDASDELVLVEAATATDGATAP